MDKNKENIYPMQKRKRAFFDIPLDDEPDYEELKKVSGIVTNMPRGQQEPELKKIMNATLVQLRLLLARLVNWAIKQQIYR